MAEVEFSEGMIDEPAGAPHRRIWPIFAIIILLLFVLLAIAWWQRTNLVGRILQDQIDKYGAQISYEVDEVGFRTQRLKNISVGDPALPDLVVAAAEIEVSLNLTGVTIRQVRAKGVKLRGNYDGKLFNFGELEKFRNKDKNKPFELPDYFVDVSGGQLRLKTPWGVIGAGLSGSGMLRQKFSGDLALRGPEIAYLDCRITNAGFDGRFNFEELAPSLDGPLRADRIACPSTPFAAVRPRLAGNFRLSKDFGHWLVNSEYSVTSLVSGEVTLKRASGKLNLDGDKDRTGYKAVLAHGALTSNSIYARDVAVEAHGQIVRRANEIAISAQGDASLTSANVERSATAPAFSLAAKTRTTPIGPMLQRLANAVQRGGEHFDADLRYDLAFGGDRPSVLWLDGVELASQSGMKVRQNGNLRVAQGSGGWTVQSPLDLRVSGGDLPDARIALRRDVGGWTGDISFDHYDAGGLALANGRMSVNAKGAGNFTGDARYSGPIPGGEISGLKMPVALNFAGGDIRLNGECHHVIFDRLRYTDFSFGAQDQMVCAKVGGSIFALDRSGLKMGGRIRNMRSSFVFSGNQVTIESPNANILIGPGFSSDFAGFRAKGRLGKSPYMVASPTVRFSTDRGFVARNVDVALGSGASASKFVLAAIDGKLRPGGLGGSLANAHGQIAQVPLLLSEAAGKWSYLRGILQFDGQSRVSDTAIEPRFLPVNVPDAHMILERNLISAIGTIHEPTTGREVGQMDIRHNLANSTGRALISVDTLTFDNSFQPVLLTEAVKGVIANVEGDVSGDGIIEWDGSGVRSRGNFGTDKMDLAAAFGPVDGLSSRIEFTDLLKLESKPGQTAFLGSVNPGVQALSGKISYHLLADARVQIEGGKWPFAGGVLLLEPTILDFDIKKPRRFTFRVEGVDAAQFLANYDFQNLQVSGIFDGTLPMIFDSDGGRIIDGTLVSRSGGGEMSYLGELTYADKGVYADYVFNALKSIRYQQLVITMNGQLDGEIITNVAFSGLQQGSLASRNIITRQLSHLPIEFNVAITAQFMQLIGSIRGLYDTAYVDQSRVPELIEAEKSRADPAKTGKKSPAESKKDGGAVVNKDEPKAE